MQAPLVDVQPHYLVDLFNWIWFIFLVAVIIGVVSKPAIYDYVSFLVKVLVSLFLMYKFNDFRTLGVFTELDKRICFMAGTNLFLINTPIKNKRWTPIFAGNNTKNRFDTPIQRQDIQKYSN
jgi:hypothetical protein